MDLNQVEIYAKTFQGVVTGAGIIIGGIWAYYRFIRGRLFTPKIELALSEKVIRTDQDKILVALEIILKILAQYVFCPLAAA
jgi:hypothetical protein